MCLEIDNPASCDIRAVIRILRAKNVSAAEIQVKYARFTAKI
jgi:hypothetical protein